MNKETFFDNDTYFDEEGYYINEIPTFMAVGKNEVAFFDDEKESIDYAKENNFKYVAKWEKDFNQPKLIWEPVKESLEEPVATSEDIKSFIEDLYDLRKASVANEGEYGLGNLVFKEFRNRGYLDELKELRKELKSKELSLEHLQESDAKLNEDDYEQNLKNRLINTYRKYARLKDEDVITEENLNTEALNKTSCYEDYDVNYLKELLLGRW